MIDQYGNPKALLVFGERESLQTGRVVLEPGPTEEVETVRRMFRMFVYEGRRQELGQRGMFTDMGIMLALRLAMIQHEPAMTRNTISTPKARARILFVLSGPLPMCRKKTR